MEQYNYQEQILDLQQQISNIQIEIQQLNDNQAIIQKEIRKGLPFNKSINDYIYKIWFNKLKVKDLDDLKQQLEIKFKATQYILDKNKTFFCQPNNSSNNKKENQNKDNIQQQGENQYKLEQEQKIKRLNKKIKQIQSLIEKQKQGGVLNDQEQQKVDQLDNIQQEIEHLQNNIKSQQTQQIQQETDKIEEEEKTQEQVQQTQKPNKHFLKKIEKINKELQEAIQLELDNYQIYKQKQIVNQYSEKQNLKNEFHKNQSQIDNNIYKLWNDEQKFLRELIVYDDSQNDFSLKYGDKNYLEYVGGVDISFDKNDKKIACAQLVVLQYPDMKMLYTDHQFIELNMPYVSGFLAFREASHILKLFERLLQKNPKLYPQVLMTDGNGIIHQNGCGIASHLGVLLDIPSIGIGKTTFCVDGLTNTYITDQYLQNTKNFGDSVDLIGNSGFVWGSAMKTGRKKDPNTPIIISIGHKISLDTAKEITRVCSQQSQIPQPVNLADLESRKLISKMSLTQKFGALQNNDLIMLNLFDLKNGQPNFIYQNGEIYGDKDSQLDNYIFQFKNSVFKN